MISIIVPLYNEGAQVHDLVAHLRPLDGIAEVVLVDASDGPDSIAVIDKLRTQFRDDLRFRLLQTARAGRAAQMNLGARASGGKSGGEGGGSILLFLHCDTRLPSTAAARITGHLAAGHGWGWFDLRLDARGVAYRLLERGINLRARLGRIPTGDQALFIERRIFSDQHGFAEIPLMEDVEMARRLRRLSRPTAIRQPVTTSARRWQQNGFVRTVLLMWKLRFRYWLGRDPARLASSYRNVR